MKLRRPAKPKPRTNRPKRMPLPLRFGDRKQAYNRIALQVRTGARPDPNSKPCSDCGKTCEASGFKHVYGFPNGWDPHHPLAVVVLCQRCLRQRVVDRQTKAVDEPGQGMLF